MKKFTLGLVIGVFIGTSVIFLSYRKVMAIGTVQYSPPSPGVTGFALPEGYYIQSYVYVPGLDNALLGKKISVYGQLGTILDGGDGMGGGHVKFPSINKPFRVLHEVK
jgi:hypothetical protein